MEKGKTCRVVTCFRKEEGLKRMKGMAEDRRGVVGSNEAGGGVVLSYGAGL